ncbi:MAG TPA: hypothetical protein VFG30_09715 [Polyangiales bacterium]|nr:hypothetical protein [Polyangiales bacterium]
MSDPTSGASDVVVWDPEDRLDNARYALLPATQSSPFKAGEPCEDPPSAAPPATRPRLPTFVCRSERTALKNGSGYMYYEFQENKTRTGTLGFQLQMVSTEGEAKLTQIATLPDTKKIEPKREITLSLASYSEKTRVLLQRNGSVQTASLRSLDPVTAVLNDALSALATIALDRAKTAAKQYARELIVDPLCNSLTVESVKGLKGSVLATMLKTISWPDDRRLLKTTCALIETLQLDELVSAQDAVWRAIGVDISALATEILRSAFGGTAAELTPVLRAASALTTNALLGSSTTERDAQVLVLSLGRVGPTAPGNWRYSMELGIAVLQECLRAGECYADELQRLYLEEIELHTADDQKKLEAAGWEGLPAILGRAASVMRPPPGTPARTTAANAIGIVLDAVDHVIEITRKEVHCTEKQTDNGKQLEPCPLPAATLNYAEALVKQAAPSVAPAAAADGADNEAPSISTESPLTGSERSLDAITAVVAAMRGIASALQGNDVTAALVELERVFEIAISENCKHQVGNTCTVPVKTSQLRRGFRVLTAVATYGASYRRPDGDKDVAELEKMRAEERRKAMETLIDSVTDRSDRADEWIYSFGTNVSLGGELRIVPASGINNYANKLPLSLRMGLAAQSVPGPDSSVGSHYMISILDLAQYASVGGGASEGNKVADPEITTALRLGGEVGLLLGKASFPLVATLQFAWIPRVLYEDQRAHSEWSAGIGLGVFVPFIDFN